MDNQQILIIALRSFLQTGDNLLANLDDTRLAFEYLDNSNKIRKYIFEKHYHNSILRAYYKDLPKVNPEISREVGESLMEKIANSNQKFRGLGELIGLTFSKSREKQRDELLQLVSNINTRTREVLDQLGSAI